MSDLIDDPMPGQNTPEYTVAEISGAVKKTIEGAFGRVRVRGEVGRVFKARSGHLYYDIKDDGNVLSCTTWKGQAARLSVQPEEGMEVIVTGKLTAFGAQSKYNMNVDEVVVAGEGALMAMLEKRKKKLAAEGLFDEARKQKIPFLPEVIGVVTSPSGAVIRDILHRLRDRFPRKVLIWPVAVQGAACAPEVTRAIEGFNRLTPGGALPRPDLLIVARGGGSIEDLWGFNEEEVARAASASQIPLISAVGHETDTTLIDYVSDLRAPTPTAAAEHAVPVRLELLAWVEEAGARLSRAIGQGVTQRCQRLRDLSRALPRPETLLDAPRQRLDRAEKDLPAALRSVTQHRKVQLTQVAAGLRPQSLSGMVATKGEDLRKIGARLTPALSRANAEKRRDFQRVAGRLSAGRIQLETTRKQGELSELSTRLTRAFVMSISRQRDRLGTLDRMRQTLGYTETLRRGYAVVRAEGALVTSVAAARSGKSLEIEFADGRFPLDAAPSDQPPAKPPSKLPSKSTPKPVSQKTSAPAKPRKVDPEQGSLF
ncbi:MULTISPECIES: exodeoxyribonuclease VII large subunit [unclassified Aliiroseovarius]|uniref:exodeoxyribonuclease VII large subunit n=1 Tax=unclassified Aliiroseovarius TaxID=2623558 RepID=UPI00156884EB|nr:MULTISPECIES: exodeoxyribonuclease VII large subunit [unclassified Aliiroseovarius]NRP12761.1 Exodeoxyribonuclease 7 large subunit [Aliiroseovarius sp. xm-d-517]NRP39794.1 Exodeoxyribonuclease 7 large subunit [Aliiroseovarius sp. xm-m-339-2]NRP60800.1 Exodeoxyribonuclease 7 large subunit [Aliiroseovarius sp. xm-a-151]